MNPPDHPDNLYQPPASTLSALLDEARTTNGSFVKVGPRRKFTGGWMNGTVTVLMFRESMLNRRSLWLGIREGSFVPQSIARAGKMCKAIQTWAQQGQSQ